MVSHELDQGAGVLTVRPEEKLEASDFEALAAIVDPYIETHGRLIGLIIATKDFPGWDNFKGLLAHMQFVRNHHTEIGRVALVTDSKIGDIGESFAKHFVKAEIKHFQFEQLGEAQAWVTEG